jgi:hypothetical protein
MEPIHLSVSTAVLSNRPGRGSLATISGIEAHDFSVDGSFEDFKRQLLLHSDAKLFKLPYMFQSSSKQS